MCTDVSYAAVSSTSLLSVPQSNRSTTHDLEHFPITLSITTSSGFIQPSISQHPHASEPYVHSILSSRIKNCRLHLRHVGNTQPHELVSFPDFTPSQSYSLSSLLQHDLLDFLQNHHISISVPSGTCSSKWAIHFLLAAKVCSAHRLSLSPPDKL